MIVNEILKDKSYMPAIGQNLEQAPLAGQPGESGSFVDSLNEMISDVNSLQKESAQLTESFIKGEPVDIHDVMIASEKAKTGFQLLLQIQSKFLDMYREINRMQV